MRSTSLISYTLSHRNPKQQKKKKEEAKAKAKKIIPAMNHMPHLRGTLAFLNCPPGFEERSTGMVVLASINIRGYIYAHIHRYVLIITLVG